MAKFLIGCLDYSRRTGMPVFLQTLSRELIKRGHEVIITAPQVGLDAEIPQYTFNEIDTQPLDYSPDFLILNEPQSTWLLKKYPNTPAFNIIHSPRECDAPITDYCQVRKFIAVKQEDYDFCLSKGVPESKLRRINIPIDFDYFKPQFRYKNRWDIGSISTLDDLRRPMLLALIEQAKKGKKVLIAGYNHGALGDLDQYKHIKNLTIVAQEINDVRPYIAQCKQVAGILAGTITAEAWAMGKGTMVYDFKGNLITRSKEPPIERMDYNVKNVVDNFLNIVNEVEADIIIPHHNRKDMLAKLLPSIPKVGFNIIVADYGGWFAKNCNEGARRAITDNLIFCNDDIIIQYPQTLWSMLDNPVDLVGCATVFPDGRPQWYGLGLKYIDGKISYYMAETKAEALMPSGGFFRVKKDCFWNAGKPDYSGFDEEYINGGEDQDLSLCAMSKGATVDFCSIPVIHHLSQSEGRFKHCDVNEDRERKKWLDNIPRLRKIFDFI